MTLKQGQILWLKLPYSAKKERHNDIHPYVIIALTDKKLQLLQCDSTENLKYRYKEKLPTNIPVPPNEIVFNKRNVIQCDCDIEIENYQELEKYRQTKSTLSKETLEIAQETKEYIKTNPYFFPMSQLKQKTYYMTKEEVEEFQKDNKEIQQTKQQTETKPTLTNKIETQIQPIPDPKKTKPGDPADGNPGR